jgi:uncharacterized protein YggT (Ycf19 family)
MAEQIRARIRGSRGRRPRAGRRPVFATLGAFGRRELEPWDREVAVERAAVDPVDLTTSAFGIVQGVFLVRIVLALISVGRTVPVAGLILALSDPLVAPFRIAAHMDPAPAAVPLLDVPALLALIVWTLVETVCLATICVRDNQRCARARDPKARARSAGWATGLAKSR